MNTELVFILDKSGSMHPLKSDTIGGFNAMLDKQKALEGSCRITTALFDNHYQLLHDRIDLQAIQALNEDDYETGGCTALLDAIGLTIAKIHNVQQSTAPAYRAEKVLVVIITDGMENASRTYNIQQVRKAIQEKTKEFDWEFIFLGANIDAIETAHSFGIAPERARNFRPDGQGMGINFEAMNHVVSSVRTCACVPPNWTACIDEDFNSRHKKPE